MMESRRSVLVALLATALVLCAFVPGGAGATMKAALIPSTQTVSIASDGNVVLLHFRADDLAMVNYAFNVTRGGKVDVLVLDEEQYELYRIGGNPAYLPGSILNQSQGSATIDGLSPGSEYYLMADNTDAPLGGASSIGWVEVDCSVYTENVTPISDANELLTWLLILIVVGFVVVVLLLARSHIAEKEPGGNIRGLGRKYCPKCGQVVASYVHKCPKCGNEW